MRLLLSSAPALAPRPYDRLLLHYGALRNHDIATGWRDRCDEVRTTNQEVADAGRAAEQIIARKKGNKADKASGSTSTSRSRCARHMWDDRRRFRRIIPSERHGRKRCSQSDSAYHRCGGSAQHSVGGRVAINDGAFDD